MPYQVTKATIERVKHALDDMMLAEGDLVFPSSMPHKLAFNIHNAIAISSQFTEYRKYSGLRGKFKVRVKPGKVLCELRTGTVDRSPAAVSVTHATKMNFEDVETVEGIVGKMLENKPDEAYFPSASLSMDSLVALWRWTNNNGYFVIDHEDAGVTVTRKKTELAFIPQME